MKRTEKRPATGRLLFDESPLIIQPSLARLVGLNEAILLQQIHYRCQEQGYPVWHSGELWAAGSPDDFWRKYFHWLTDRHVRRLFQRLVSAGYLVRTVGPTHPHLWRLNYAEIAALGGAPADKMSGQNVRESGQNVRESGQNVRENRVSSSIKTKSFKNIKDYIRPDEPETGEGFEAWREMKQDIRRKFSAAGFSEIQSARLGSCGLTQVFKPGLHPDAVAGLQGLFPGRVAFLGAPLSEVADRG